MRFNKHLAPLILAFAGGLIVLYLSGPQFLGGVKLIAHERTLEDLGGVPGARPVTPARLADAVSSWDKAAPLLDDGDAWVAEGDLRVAAARVAGNDQIRRIAELRLAIAAYRKALERDPANARAWAMLAVARIELDATPDEIFPLLRMSLHTGAHEPDLAFIRLDVAFFVWSILPPDMEQAMAGQVIIAARHDVVRLAQIVRRHHELGAVRDILNVDPDLKWNFDYWYTRMFG